MGRKLASFNRNGLAPVGLLNQSAESHWTTLFEQQCGNTGAPVAKLPWLSGWGDRIIKTPYRHLIPNLHVVVLETDAENTCDAYGAVSERQAKRELKAVPR